MYIHLCPGVPVPKEVRRRKYCLEFLCHPGVARSRRVGPVDPGARGSVGAVVPLETPPNPRGLGSPGRLLSLSLFGLWSRGPSLGPGIRIRTGTGSRPPHPHSSDSSSFPSESDVDRVAYLVWGEDLSSRPPSSPWTCRE